MEACAHTFESRVMVSPPLHDTAPAARYQVLLSVRCQACHLPLVFELPIVPTMPGMSPLATMSSNGQEAMLAAHLATPALTPETEVPWQPVATLPTPAELAEEPPPGA